MKAMPVDDIISIIKKQNVDIISKDYVEELFDRFGDDWFYDRCTLQFELTTRNSDRNKYLNKKEST